MKKINFKDVPISLFQDNVETALRPLEAIPMVNGVLLTNIDLLSGQDNLVRHGLGHAPQVFFIGNQNVDTRVWSPATAALNGASSDRTFLNLRCSTTCRVAVWVN